MAAVAVTVVDDRGVAVNFDRPPQRIVSLLPSVTELVCELGQCSRLVGVDKDSNYPAMVQKLPIVGGVLDPSIEAIAQLRPDVVLLATYSNAGDRLQALGIKTFALQARTYADVQKSLVKLGQVLRVDDPQRILRDIDTGVAMAAQSLPVSVHGVRVYFEIDPAPYAAGEGSFIGETLSRLGVRNIVTANMGLFPKLNPEFVVRANPDVIMVGPTSAGGVAERPGWSQIRAIKEHRICMFTAQQEAVLIRPGPRMAEAARHVAECLTRVYASTSTAKQ
jgi:iron complex transport system substrate-binding protein